MTPRRREIEKIYNKINKLAQKGSDYVFEYYTYIDELIASGKYSILEDVMLTKYEISMRAFTSVNLFKEFSFKEIRKFTNYNSSEALQKLLETKSVYLIGFKLFDKNTNHYLGDVREEQIDNQIFRYNRKLFERTIEVVAEAGIKSSAFEVVPRFEDNTRLINFYDVNEHLIYSDKIYQCIQGYTYSSTNRITPTFSSFWTSVNLPGYSRLGVTSSNLTLVDKYSQAIDFLKGFTYSFT
jgi:hypothetical protein